MIRDLESMILTISDPASRDYVREALQCYNAGAYRAAVVLSVAAGMDGLRRRLADLANSGGVSADTTTAHANIDRAFNNQDSFERTLIDASEKAVSFLTVSEAKKLRALFDVRNLCAHPSGHIGTAEEARDAMTTVIDFILSRPALMGMTGISTLLDRLKSPNFFPNINAWKKTWLRLKKRSNY